MTLRFKSFVIFIIMMSILFVTHVASYAKSKPSWQTKKHLQNKYARMYRKACKRQTACATYANCFGIRVMYRVRSNP